MWLSGGVARPGPRGPGSKNGAGGSAPPGTRSREAEAAHAAVTGPCARLLRLKEPLNTYLAKIHPSFLLYTS